MKEIIEKLKVIGEVLDYRFGTDSYTIRCNLYDLRVELSKIDIPTYQAVYLPGDNSDSDPSKIGFKTREEAWDYINSMSCEDCKSNPTNIDTCSSEWIVDIDQKK